MNHTIQFPLCVDLAPAAQRESVHPHCMHDIAEHRLDGSHTSAIVVPSAFRIEACDHLLGRTRGVVTSPFVAFLYLPDF